MRGTPPVPRAALDLAARYAWAARHIEPGACVLAAGCSSEAGLRQIAAKAGRLMLVTRPPVSPVANALAAEGRAELMVAPPHDPPPEPDEPGAADAVLMLEDIEHWVLPLLCLIRYRAWVREGGALLLCGMAQERVPCTVERWPAHFQHVTEAALHAWLSEAGCGGIAVEPIQEGLCLSASAKRAHGEPAYHAEALRSEWYTRLTEKNRALAGGLAALARRVETLEEAAAAAQGQPPAAPDDSLAREVAGLRMRLQRHEQRSQQQLARLRADVRGIKQHPAYRRLARFNAAGLKLLGLLGIGGPASGAHAADAPLPQAGQAATDAAGKTPAAEQNLREDAATYVRGYCSVAYAPRHEAPARHGEPMVLDVSRLFSPHLTGVGHYCDQLTRAILRTSERPVAAFSAKALPKWMLESTHAPPFYHLPPGHDGGNGTVADLADLTGQYYGYLHASAQHQPLIAAEPMTAIVYDLAPIAVPESVPRNVAESCQAYNRFLASNAARFIAISEFTKQAFVDFSKISPERVTVVPPGIDPIFTRPIEPHDMARVRAHYGLSEPYLLCVGTLQPRKNLLRLIEAYAHLRKAGEHLPQLILAGTDRWVEMEDFRRKLEQERLAHDIRFTGYVGRNDMPALYAMSTLFIYPSYYEGYGMPVAEAMASGAAVACANATSLPEVAGEAAAYFDPKSTDDMAETLHGVIANGDRLRDLREQAVERATSFLSWDDVAQRILGVCEEAARA